MDDTVENAQTGETAASLLAHRFALHAEIGAGGMGVVWRGRDRHTGRPVAVKRLRAGHGERRFLDEARVLEGLRHPGIVAWLAHGIDDAGPWIAMEWVDGETLAARLLRGALGPTDCARLGSLLAGALAWAHGRGVVHRDVKPSNVILREGRLEQPVLIDFGVAVAADRAMDFTATGHVVGTPGYMAPEQVRGERPLDGRADLFSLGCLLWECLCGRPAFCGPDPVAVLGRILFEQPLPPPGPLGAVVADLLAKRREDRPADASVVAARLVGLTDLGTTATHAIPTAITDAEQRVVAVIAALPPPSGSADQEVLRRVARSHGARLEVLAAGPVLSLLADDLPPSDLAAKALRCGEALAGVMPGWRLGVAVGRACLDGVAGKSVDRAVAVAGAADPGGVATDVEAERLLRGRAALSDLAAGVPVVLGMAPPLTGREKELALMEATLSQCLDESAPAALLLVGEAGLGKTRLCRELLTRAVHSGVRVLTGRGSPGGGGPFALLEAALRGVRDTADTTLDLPRPLAALFGETLTEVDHQTPATLRDAAVATLRSAAASRGLVLFLEDLHWADGASIEAVDNALRALRNVPLLVLANARPEVVEWLPQRWAEGVLTTVRLAALSHRASERLVRVLARGRLPEARVAQILDGGRGNPLMLEELTRAAVTDPAAPLPDTVLALIQRRLDEVPPEGRRVLRAASVFGTHFWKGGLAAVLGDLDLDAWIERLQLAEILDLPRESTLPGEEEFTFRHWLVRDAVHAMLTAEDHQLGHRLAADWLEAAGVHDPAVLAAHRDAAGDLETAARLYLRAARRARLAGDWRSLAAAADRICAVGPPDLRGQGELLAGEACLGLGSPGDAVRRIEVAVGLLSEDDPDWCYAVSRLVFARSMAGAGPVADAEAEAVLARVRGAACLDGAQIHALADASLTLLIRGEERLGAELLDEAAQALARSPGAGIGAHIKVHQSLAYTTITRGELDRALRHGQAAVEAATAGACRYEEITSRMIVGLCSAHLGLLERAEATLQDTLAHIESSDFTMLLGVANDNLGMVRFMRGRLDEAAETLDQAIRAQGGPRYVGSAHTNRARVALEAGDPERAETEARRATALLSDIPPLRPKATAALAAALLARGCADEGLALARSAMDDVAAQGGRVEEGEAFVRLVHVRALAMAGLPTDEARADAWSWLSAKAGHIADLALRESFLAGVPDHAAICAAAGAEASGATFGDAGGRD